MSRKAQQGRVHLKCEVNDAPLGSRVWHLLEEVQLAHEQGTGENKVYTSKASCKDNADASAFVNGA